MGGAGPPQPGRSQLSPAALDLYRACEVVDLHVETFVWTRILGYDLTARHGPGPLRARYLGQADLPRLRAAGVSAVVLSIATNPARRTGTRTPTLLDNLSRLQRIISTSASTSGSQGLTVYLAVQGGNAFDSPADVRLVPDGALVRVTLMHLTDSRLGATSSPLGRSRGRGGLTAEGRALVEALNERRILLDLAHASRPTFFDALDALDACHPALPPVVTHTGISGVHPSWRNLDDTQIRAIAERGGVIGIMYHRGFLGRPPWKVGAEAIVRHLEHAIAVGGEDIAALGSDWDGMIVTPRDMPTCLELPVLVDRMLARGWQEPRIRRVLGANALRVIAAC
ncbi:MAG TPA: membrane dipeptidase [Acidimicrobiia bacterium]|nr:membrane dipeptidase [Acidimicrobiia bacterium]